MSLQTLAKSQTIAVRFCLEPSHIDSEYKERLLTFLKQKYEKQTFKDHGYILEVLRIRQILREEVMSMIPNIFFMMQVDVLCYYPKVRDRLKMTISKIFHHGVFCTEEKIRTLLPIALCPGHVVQKDFSSFYFQNTTSGVCYRKNDLIEVQLLEVRFEKDGFSCVGTIAV